MVAAQRHQRQALLATRSSRHGNFGGVFKVHTAFGTDHVSHALNSSGDAELPQAAKKRARAPCPVAPRVASLSPRLAAVVRSAVVRYPVARSLLTAHTHPHGRGAQGR
jgi:hypothetical protein